MTTFLHQHSMDFKIDKVEKHGKTSEELEKELHKLKRKLKSSRHHLQQTRSEMEVQALRTRQLVTAWTSRLERAEERVTKERYQKDLELREINGQLMLLQGRLKKEQQFIMAELVKKNKLIHEQNKTIRKLHTENKRLQEEAKPKKDEHIDDQYVTLASIDEMIKRKNSTQLLQSPHVNSDSIQEAFDIAETDRTLASSDINKGKDLTQESFSDMNITQDDVFKDTSIDYTRDKFLPSFTIDEDSYVVPRPRSKTVSVLDRSVEYSNHKIIKRRKNVTKDTKQGHSGSRRSKHMSIDIDLNKSFDSVTFNDSCNYPRDGHDYVNWYLSSSDKENDDDSRKIESSSFIISDDGDRSVRGFDQKTDGFFYRDVQNQLRHKTVKRKRKRSKSLSDTNRMPVIFLAQSEPDIAAHVEVDIDEAIARKHRARMQVV